MVGAQDATAFSVSFSKLMLTYLLAFTTADINNITLYPQLLNTLSILICRFCCL